MPKKVEPGQTNKAESLEGNETIETERQTAELAGKSLTPEEIYVEKLSRAANRVSQELNSQKITDLQVSLADDEEKKLPVSESPPPTLKALIDKENHIPKGIVDSLKERVQAFILRRRGVRDPKQFGVFAKYLEENLTESEDRDMIVEKNKAEETRKDLPKSGKKVRWATADFQDKSKVRISYTEEVPYHVHRGHIKRIDALLGKANDPVEIIERLQKLGFGIEGHTFEYQADALQGFIENAHMPQTLKLLQEIGVKVGSKYFGKPKEEKKSAERSDVEEIEAMAGDETFLASLNPETISRVHSLLKATKFSPPINKNDIEILAETAHDPDMAKVFIELSHRSDSGLEYGSEGVPRLIRALKKEGLIRSTAQAMDVVSASMLFRDRYIGEDTNLHEKIEALREVLNSGCVKGILEKPAELEYLHDVSTLSGCRLGADAIQRITEQCDARPTAKQEILVVLSAMHASGVKFDLYNFKDGFGVVGENITDRKAMERFLDLGFQDFLSDLHKASGSALSYYDFMPKYNSMEELSKLYGNQEVRDLILSDRVSRLLKTIGKFEIDKIETYKNLAGIDGMPEVIDQLKEVYGFRPDSSYQLSANHLAKLAEDTDARKKLFSEATVNFFKRLQKDYRLNFNVAEMDLLISMASDPVFIEKLSDPVNADLLKAAGGYSVGRIISLVGINDELKPVLTRLAKDYNYQIEETQLGNSKFRDEEGVLALAADAESQKKLFDPGVVSRVDRLKKCGSFYRVSVSDLHKFADVPEDAVAYVEQLGKKIKYVFSMADLPDIEKHKTDEKILGLMEVLDAFSYKFKIEDIDRLGQLEKYPPDVIREKLSLFGDVRISGVQKGYEFSTMHIDALIACIENNYNAGDFASFDAIGKKYLWEDYKMEIHSIPNLAFLRDHEEDIVKTMKELEGYGMNSASINPVLFGDRLQKIHDYDLFGPFKDFKGDAEMQRFIFNNTERIAGIEPEKRKAFIDVVLAIKQSPSQEIKRIEDQLTGELLKTDDPVAFYRKVEDIFIKNNLPAVGKIYKIFETLYSPGRVKDDLEQHNGSPMLESAGARKRGFMIYQDLLRTHIRSGNRSLRNYAEVLEQSEPLLAEADEAGINKLDEEKKEQLSYLLGKFNTLYLNSALGKHANIEVEVKTDLKKGLDKIKKDLGVREGQTIVQRIAEMYLKPIGLSTVSELLEEMKEDKKNAHERGLKYAQDAGGKPLDLKPGDLLKGVDQRFIGTILQNGSVSKEFLGASSSQDATPFDTDVSMVLAQDTEGGFGSAVHASMARDYGNLMFAVRDRSQFNVTRREHKEQLENIDTLKLELFQTRGERHYGIRTGFPTTEIDYIIVQDNFFRASEAMKDLNNLYFEIAQNGYYIPVTNEQGNIIFTPENYRMLRKTFDGLERFDGDALRVVESDLTDKSYKEVSDLVAQRKESGRKVIEIEESIRKSVEKALAKSKINLRSKYDTSILGADLVETGSMGRQTNLEGDFDFDFALKLDAKDFPNAVKIAEDLKRKMVMEKDNSHTEESGYYQLRAEGVSKIGNVVFDPPISIDIGFADRSELAVFDTQEALAERYDWIREHEGQEAYERVLANVVLAKKILKKGKAYKKFEEGGLGGVGLENWIIANGGNIVEAFKSFLNVAKKDGRLVPLNQFQETYKIIDPGVNIKEHRHDDFVHKLTGSGYENMIKAIEDYLAG